MQYCFYAAQRNQRRPKLYRDSVFLSATVPSELYQNVPYVRKRVQFEHACQKYGVSSPKNWNPNPPIFDKYLRKET